LSIGSPPWSRSIDGSWTKPSSKRRSACSSRITKTSSRFAASGCDRSWTTPRRESRRCIHRTALMSQALLANLIVFARTLRASGLSVRASGVPDAVRALAEVGIGRKADVRDALRPVFVYRRDDGAQFDALFEQFWRVWPEAAGALPRPMHLP